MKSKLRTFVALCFLFFSILPIVNLTSSITRQRLTNAIRQSPPDKALLQVQNALLDLAPVSDALNRLTWTLGINTQPDQVVIGPDGWLNLGDAYAQTITVHRAGTTSQDRIDAQAVSTSMLTWQQWLTRHGVQSFTVLVAPDKQSVHPDTVPAWARQRPPRRVEALFNGPAKGIFLDVLPDLQRASQASAHALFYKTDSHWNYLGGAHAFQSLGRRLKALPGQAGQTWVWPTEPEPQVQRLREQQGRDLARLIGIGRLTHDVSPVVSIEGLPFNRPAIVDFYTRQAGQASIPQDASQTFRSVVLLHNAKAPNRQRVVWAHDSFGAAMAPFMHASMANIVELHVRDALDAEHARLVDIVQTWKPQHVILTVVERSALGSLMQSPPPQ